MLMGPIFVLKTKKLRLKKRNLVKGLVSVHFFTSKDPLTLILIRIK